MKNTQLIERAEHITQPRAKLLEAYRVFTEEGWTPKNASQYKTAATALTVLKNEMAAAEAELAELTGPLKLVIKKIEAKLKPALKEAKTLEVAIKAALVSFREASPSVIEKALTEGDTASASAARAPEIDGIQIRARLESEIYDVSSLPEEYVTLIGDKKALDALARATKGDPGIPGYRARYVESIAVVKA